MEEANRTVCCVFLSVVGIGNGTKMLSTMLAGSKVSVSTYVKNRRQCLQQSFIFI